MDHEQLQKLIKLMSSLKSKVQCPICLDFPVHVAELPCTHMFCNNCISQLRSEINPKCPICLTLISRRAVCYKDQFANKLSKFVNDVCQLIKEKYAYEVDELCSNKYDLKKIIELAPQEFCKTTALIHGKAEQSPEGFDLLKPGIRKCYFNKKRESLKNKLLDIADRKSKVVNWLNNNQQETLNLLVTSDQCSSHEEGDFQMPSISQVISESRVEKENLKTCQDYEHVKLKEVMDHTDDYNIEETPSEALARQVERKVVQEILEDECLANLERIAKLDKNLGEKPTNSKNATSVLTEQTKDKRRSSGKQCISPNDSGSSSGWERMENFTKSIKKRCKGYKQLKIHQGGGGGVRKEKRASRNRQDQPAKQNSKKQLKLEVSRGQDASDGVQKNCVEEKESPNREMVILINKNISLDMEKNYLGIVKDKKAATEAKHKKTANLTDKPLKKVTDQLVNSTDSDNDDIFYLATQLTPDTINRQTNLYLISPVPDELDNVNDVAVRLSDHLKSCAGIANLNNSKGLANCFTDLLSYANRIVKNSSRKVQKKVATTQTVLVNSTVAVQTELLNENKHVQTINKMLQSVATDMSVNKAIQTSGNNLGNIVEGDKTNPDPPENYYPINSNESEAILASQSQLSKSRRSVTQSSPNQVVRKAKHISQDFKRKKVLHISTDESKESKLTKSSNQISEGSVLTYSLDSPKSSVKRTNSKFRKSQNRKFKRIRELNVNSDSDESGNPSKRKFVRDDLTVEFADTEPSDRNEVEVQFTLDSEKMDYDGYLLEVMKNYDAAPSNMRNPKKEETLTNQSINCNKQVVTNTDVQTQKSKCAPDTGDHIFTACLALEENFCKFDNEILEFEKSVKTCNTEMDVVENTPGISPKSKRISRLPSKKNSLVRPDLIPTKGSTSSFSEKNIGLTEDLLRSIVGPSTLNRKFENVHSQTGKLTEDVRDILSELKGNEEFFENEDIDVGDTNIETRTQNNIDKNLHEFDDDQEIEGILKQISITGDQSSSSKPNGIVILQNIKIKSQNKTNKTPDDVICSSDEEIIETTPQKKKSTSKDRSVLENLPLEQNGFCGDPDDNLSGLYLPPPPGFDDAPSISQCNEKENCDPSSSFLTPDQFTDFLVTPDENINHSENPNDLDTSVATLNRPAVKKLMNLKLSRRMFINDQENILSPIPQSSKPVAESNHNPLVYIPRLSLKKPTLMTSTPNQKSILNYVVSSSSEDGSGKQSQKSKPCIMWSRILNKDLNIFTQLECKKLLTTSKVFNSRVTHVIVLVDEKGQIVSHTAKILQAIAAGIWVVRYEWAVDCLRMNRIVPEDPYEALDVSGVPGPQKSRLSDKSDPLFKKFRFYCAPPLESISKGDLQSILQLAGGEIVEDQADLLIKDGKICMILTESSASEETEQYEEWLEIYKAVTVDVEWLSVCIGQYEVVSFRPYLVTGDETAVCDLGYPLTLIQSVSFSLTEPS